MSWSVSVFGGSEVPPIQDPDWEPTAIGSGDEVRERISAYLPGVDWTDPTWGLYGGNGFTFEFSVSGDDPLITFAVHVRGGGDAVADLLRFSVPNGWHLLDWSTGRFINPASPSCEGWQGWQEYRDKIRAESRGVADGS